MTAQERYSYPKYREDALYSCNGCGSTFLHTGVELRTGLCLHCRVGARSRELAAVLADTALSTQHQAEHPRCVHGHCTACHSCLLWHENILCDRCRQRAYRMRRRRRQAGSDRQCTCGAVFTPSRSDGRYCSNACRQRAYRKRSAS